MEDPKPFTIAVSDEKLAWINYRVKTAHIPPGKNFPQDELWRRWGLPAAYAQRLHKYWTTKYDWRKVEKQLNTELQQFTLSINHNGEDISIHFVHQRSNHPDAIPFLFLHGWPGSFLEVRKLVPLLTDPKEGEQAYHIVAPSLPGYGFSGYPSKACSPVDMAEINHKLMLALSYSNFIVQGGDWGSMIARCIALSHPESCRGVHLNMVVATPPSPIWHPWAMARLICLYLFGVGATESQKNMLKRSLWWMTEESGYLEIQGTKPQTVNYALTDSPFGMMCWLRDKIEFLTEDDDQWEDDDVITWAMPYILNGTPGHAEIYRWGKTHLGASMFTDALFSKIIDKSVGVGASIFPKDVFYCPRWWAECKIARNIVFWKEHERGGHFPSIEQPTILASDIRKFTNALDKAILQQLRKQ